MASEQERNDPCERRFRIGYALAPKKQQSFIQNSLLSLSASRRIDLVKINPEVPISAQGPFDCLLHKLSNSSWRDNLESYSAAHPDVPIIDELDSIERLHNRISMLQVVSELDTNPSETGETFGIPSQVVVYDQSGLGDTGLVGALRFPIIAKPLVADGTARSHKMSLVFNKEGLRKQKPPLVLQEFVNHGGVIFKVYVVGEHVTCVKRKSLPDVSKESLESPVEISVSFSQVSNLPTKLKQEDQENQETEEVEDDDLSRLEEAELPPLSFVKEIAKGLRKALGLRLFNFDMIRDIKVGNRYLIIDINYFPGYAKMPDYERVLTEFFEKVRDEIEGKKGEIAGEIAGENHKEA